MKLLVSTPHAMAGSGPLQVYMDVDTDDIDPELESARADVKEARSQGRQVGAIWYPSLRRPGIFTYDADAAPAVEAALIAQILSGPTLRVPSIQCYGGGA
jgi:hypothetical protein